MLNLDRIYKEWGKYFEKKYEESPNKDLYFVLFQDDHYCELDVHLKYSHLGVIKVRLTHPNIITYPNWVTVDFFIDFIKDQKIFSEIYDSLTFGFIPFFSYETSKIEGDKEVSCSEYEIEENIIQALKEETDEYLFGILKEINK